MSGHAPSEPLHAALHYAAELPLRWSADAVPVEARTREHLAEANLRLLGQIAQIEERAAPVDDPTATDIELARLHAKLDLLLFAVGELAPRFLDRPERCALQLSWRGVRWLLRPDETAPQGEGVVEIYLHPVVLQPLRWPARIVHNDRHHAEAEFAPLGEAAQQALERHVFQHHRRAVAEARAAGSRRSPTVPAAQAPSGLKQ